MLSKPFVLQREVREGGRNFWFDAERFETKERALQQLNYARTSAQLRIQGNGGSNWSGEHVQNMRIVKVQS